MKHQKFRQLLKKYREGSGNQHVEKLINSFFDDMQDDGEEFHVFKQDLHLKNRLYQNIEKGISEKHNRKKVAWIMAASFLVLFSLSALSFLFNRAEMIKIVTACGEQQKFYLPDSSLVILNADSKLEYPREFSLHKREINLNGEAFFEVKHKKDQPFYVHTNMLRTQVLGTKFSVNSYENLASEVIVLNGKVSVSAGDELENVLIRNQRIRLINGVFIKDTIEASRNLLWIDGGLSFNNAGLLEVVRTLERRKDVNIQSTFDLNNISGSLTGDFSELPIEDILESIQYIFEINIKIDKDDQIILTLKKSSNM